MNQQLLERAMHELNAEIEKLSAARSALRTALNGAGTGASAPVAAGKLAAPAKPGRKRTRVPDAQGPSAFARRVIDESRTPLTTEEVVKRATEAGFTPRSGQSPSAAIYGALRYLEMTHRLRRVGTDWTRV